MKKAALILLALLLIGFILGLNHLFKLRFQAGDIYPAYSSLRTDPLGSKALYDSFDQLLQTRRNFKPLLNIDRGQGMVLFVLGVDPKELRLSESDVKDIEQFVTTGGRLVLTFEPAFTKREISTGRSGPTNSPAGKKGKKSIIEQDEQRDGISLSDRWRFDMAINPLARDEEKNYLPAAARRVIEEDLPLLISTHTALTLEALDPAWRSVYVRTNDAAVIMDRKLGSGSIVLSTDSYLFSNEALLKERRPQLLAWFAGANGIAIFDETHLGVQEHRGVATLARKYRLHGFVAGLLLLSALFVWKYAFTLVPPHEEELQRQRSQWVTGKESSAGFTNLLRRNIAPRALLKTCLEEWNRSCRKGVPLPKLEKVQNIIDAENARPDREVDPVRTYQEISQVLSRKPMRGSQTAGPTT
jgi:Domain of unknown function (DUF4350)